MTETWTLPELVAEAVRRLAALPPPKNGQVRAVPDERTIRYYGTIGLLDRPAAMRGRTALYGRRHLAQVVAIKRMQSAGHSLADIQRMWTTLDDVTLSRMSGVQVASGTARRPARKEFWKREAEAVPQPQPYSRPQPSPQPSPHAQPQPSPHAQPQPQPSPQPSYPAPLPAPGGPDRSGPSAGAPVVLPVPTFTPYPATASAPGSPATPTITIPLDGNASIVIAVPEGRAISLSPADVRALRAAAAPLVAELAKCGLAAPAKDTLEEP